MDAGSRQASKTRLSDLSLVMGQTLKRAQLGDSSALGSAGEVMVCLHAAGSWAKLKGMEGFSHVSGPSVLCHMALLSFHVPLS